MRYINNLTILAFVLLTVAGCSVDSEQYLPERSYSLTWSDEFNGEAGELPNSENWVFDLGTGQNGWGNNELQSCTNNPENISLDGEGNLVITAIKNNDNYTSGRIKTQGLFSQKYGKIEARIKTPTGKGIWPAFWMLGDNIDEIGWPQCGEIDIMEQKGQLSSTTYASLHGPGYSGGQAITTPYSIQNSRFDTDFFVYSVEWGEDYVDFLVNDFLYKRLTPEDITREWVYNNQSFFLILNVAVGGAFVGLPNDNTPFPQAMKIDYVRVYKEN